MKKTDTSDWLGLAIGNSRLHWAWFRGQTLLETHESQHLTADWPEANLPSHWPEDIPLYFASVVPEQTALLNPQSKIQNQISLAQIPLQGIYPTMGIDRAIALWGAVQTYGLPILVIDAGTALTFTGAGWGERGDGGDEGDGETGGRGEGGDGETERDGEQGRRGAGEIGENSQLGSAFPQSKIHPRAVSCFEETSNVTPSQNPKSKIQGGAILPGLRLQFETLGQKTAALPEVQLPETLPPRWSLDTPSAIASGVLYTVLAGIRDFIEDWLKKFPESRIILTGGDSAWLFEQLKHSPEIASYLAVDPHLIFWGMRSLKQ